MISPFFYGAAPIWNLKSAPRIAVSMRCAFMDWLANLIQSTT
ncbi:hypothetical protein [Pseudomonas sp. DR48]|nr:hypothetical protein [Pseudomonas sp. DR48]